MAQAQRDLFDQVEQRVALHAHRLVGIIFNALFRDGQNAEARASQSRDGHQIMGPYDVTFRGTQRTDPLDRGSYSITDSNVRLLSESNPNNNPNKQNGLTMHDQHGQQCASPCQQHQRVFVAAVAEVGEVGIIPQEQEVSQCFVVLLRY